MFFEVNFQEPTETICGCLRKRGSYFRKKTFYSQTLPFVHSAHNKYSWVADLTPRFQPLVDSAGCCHTCSALHHPNLHGPTDHSCHRQQEGEQTQGQDNRQDRRQLRQMGCKNDKLSVFGVLVVERRWLPLGSARGGCDAWCMLHHGPAMVCSGYCPLYLPCEQSKGGVRMCCSRWAAKVPGHQRAACHRLHDLHPHGLFRLHDLCPEGELFSISFHQK